MDRMKGLSRQEELEKGVGCTMLPLHEDYAIMR